MAESHPSSGVRSGFYAAICWDTHRAGHEGGHKPHLAREDTGMPLCGVQTDNFYHHAKPRFIDEHEHAYLCGRCLRIAGAKLAAAAKAFPDKEPT